MIAADQPTIFGGGVVAAVSSKNDGNIKFGLYDDAETLANRQAFLEKVGIDIRYTSLVGITYNTDDFAKYRIATSDDKAVGMLAPNMKNHVDALVVTQPNHALFLPIADCVGAILYDPAKRVLMVSHLGRHSAEQHGAQRSVEYLQQECGSRPQDLKIWLSPAVGKATYPLRKFDGRSLHEVLKEQLLAAGVDEKNIQLSLVDTATDPNYYSYSEYLKGNRTEPSRFAVVAMMTAQGEPAV